MKIPFSSLYFFLTRLLLVFSAPLFYALLCIALGAYFHHFVFWIGLLFLLLLSLRPVYDSMERKLFARYLNFQPGKQLYDYAIVMGGFSRYDHARNRIEFNEKADRLIEALLFYKRGCVKKIIITGDGSISQLHPRKGDTRVEGSPEQMWCFLETFGVPREDVLLELYARNTLENALAVHQLLKEKEESTASLLMITSAYHVKRALASFSITGLFPDYYAVDMIKDFVPPPLYWLPDLEVPGKWQELLHQFIGTFVLKLQRKNGIK